MKLRSLLEQFADKMAKKKARKNGARQGRRHSHRVVFTAELAPFYLRDALRAKIGKLQANTLHIDKWANRFRILRVVPEWLWRLAVSLLLGGLAITILVPWAETQRGYAAIGGEYCLTLAAFILPWCFFRRG